MMDISAGKRKKKYVNSKRGKLIWDNEIKMISLFLASKYYIRILWKV
jgi:hypothetical protein